MRVKPWESVGKIFFLSFKLVHDFWRTRFNIFLECMKINYTCSKGVSVKHISFETATHLNHKEAEEKKQLYCWWKSSKKMNRMY